MPNNIDMGGFGSPGLPVLSRLDGSLVVTAGNGPSTPLIVSMNSAGAAALNMLDLRAGGVSQMNVSKAGLVSTMGGASGAGFKTDLYLGVGFSAWWGRSFNIFGVSSPDGNARVTVNSDGFYQFSSQALGIESPDVMLRRDAAGVLAQRNTTNAQAFRVYGTYTDASNYVCASLAATSTAVTLTAETAGTGADNVPVILTPAGTSQVEVGNGVQFTEMTAPSAPAANKVILFAQDNGAGKTQLMALFPSGAAQQVAIEP